MTWHHGIDWSPSRNSNRGPGSGEGSTAVGHRRAGGSRRAGTRPASPSGRGCGTADRSAPARGQRAGSPRTAAVTARGAPGERKWRAGRYTRCAVAIVRDRRLRLGRAAGRPRRSGATTRPSAGAPPGTGAARARRTRRPRRTARRPSRARGAESPGSDSHTSRSSASAPGPGRGCGSRAGRGTPARPPPRSPRSAPRSCTSGRAAVRGMTNASSACGHSRSYQRIGLSHAKSFHAPWSDCHSSSWRGSGSRVVIVSFSGARVFSPASSPRRPARA